MIGAEDRNPRLWLGWLALFLLFVTFAFKERLTEPPPVRTATAPGSFDAVAAKGRLARILGDERPHPVDSAGNDAVRERLILELRGLGLSPIVRDQTACNAFRRGGTVACARVRNVIATLGPAQGKALLLSAHYDSSPAGPGAADAGIGVATLLESAAVLRREALGRPIVLLFNDGEEYGLLGARAFLNDPVSRNVDSVLNFEARGVTGPVTMFETSRPNGPAVTAFARSVERPFASSLMTDVYQRMPNDTDVTVFRERGWLALNFAMTGNETRYHSAGDNLAALDPRSLQHMGDQALAAARELSRGIPQVSASRMFIDLAGRWLLHTPHWLGLVIFAALLVAFVWLGAQRRAFRRETGAILAAAVIGVGIAWMGTTLIGALRPGTYWRAVPEAVQWATYGSTLLAAVIGIGLIARRSTPERLRTAYWLLFLMVGGLLALAAPGALIYFVLPPLAVVAGVVAGRWRASAEPAGALLGLALLLITWGAMLSLLEELLSPGPQWLFAPIAMILILPAIIEAKPLLDRIGPGTATAAAAVLAATGWIAAGLAHAYSPDRQQAFTVEHVTLFPGGRASWSVLNDDRPLPDGFGGGDWRYGVLPYSERKRWLTPAPALARAAPSVEILSNIRRGGQRVVTLRLNSRGSDSFTLRLPEKAQLRAAGIAGKVRPIAPEGSGSFALRCGGRSCDGAVATLVIGSAAPVTANLVAVRYGLPAAARTLVAARPATARPQYTPDQTVSAADVSL